MRRVLFFLVLLCITGVSALNVWFNYQIQYIIDALNTRDLGTFTTNILVMVAIMVALLVFEYFNQYLNVKYLNSVGLDIHRSIIRKIYSKNYSDFKKKSIGDYLSILNNDIDRIKDYHYSAIIALYQGLVSFGIASMALFSLNSMTAALILLVSVFPVIVPYLFRKQNRAIKNRLSNRQSVYNTFLKDFISGFLDIKNSNSSALYVSKVNNHYNEVNKCYQDESKLTALMNVLIGLFFYATVVSILFVGGKQVLAGSITVGALASIIALSN